MQHCKDETGTLHAAYSTDSFGGNLVEMVFWIEDDMFYPKDYNPKLVARNQGYLPVIRIGDLKRTFFDNKVRITKTLRGTGDYDFQRAQQIKLEFNIPDPIAVFFDNLLSYATGKYVLAGLITNKYTVNWLYRKNNDLFFELLAESPFAELKEEFFDMFPGYENYFRFSKTVE